MASRYGADPVHRLKVEFVEADIEIGFGLVDMAEEECRGRRGSNLPRLLEQVEEVYLDIGRRLRNLDQLETENFGPLIGELRRAIDQAKAHARS